MQDNTEQTKIEENYAAGEFGGEQVWREEEINGVPVIVIEPKDFFQIQEGVGSLLDANDILVAGMEGLTSVEFSPMLGIDRNHEVACCESYIHAFAKSLLQSVYVKTEEQ